MHSDFNWYCTVGKCQRIRLCYHDHTMTTTTADVWAADLSALEFIFYQCYMFHTVSHELLLARHF